MPRVPDVWTALRLDYDDHNRNDVLLRVIGRLKPGVTLEQAQLQVDGIAEGLRQHFAIKQTAGLYLHAVPMYEDLVGSVRPAILSLLGAVVFVLMIACANVANLLVVRASARSGDLAVRAAIGASRWQLMRQILAESLVVAALGGLLGVALARAGVRLLLALGPQDMPRLEGVAVDSRVLAFAVLAGIVTAFACGILPALQVARLDAIEALRRSGGRASGLRGGRRLRNLLVITEVALSFILLVGAMLTLRSFAALSRVNPGFDPGNLLTFYLPAPFPEPGQRAAFMQQLRARLLAIPGASAVTAASPLPLDGGIRLGRWGTEAAVADPGTFRQASFHAVLPGYFEAMRTPVLEGRAFTEADNAADPAKRLLVIDNLLAARAFPNQSAVGKRLLVRVNTPEPEWWEVLGVVAHQRHASLAADGPEAIFLPDGYFGHGNATRWAVRGGGDPAKLATAVRAAVAEVAPRWALAELQPMQAFVDRAMAPLRFATTLIGIFAIVAVALAGLGLYGVLHSIVRQRTAEIGLRMAFGAPRGGIFALVVGQGLKLAALGIVAGLAGAAVVTRVMTSLLVGVTPTDPLTFASMTALFFVVAGVACWLPALRASHLEPTVALRED
jgi:putative ABC transport system permease protein